MKVVCVNVGKDTIFRKYGYTMKLLSSLNRNSKRDWTFECIAASEYPGWWAKMEIFPAKERTIYLDLDTVITGNIDFLFDYDGPFCIRRNPWPNCGWCDASLMSIAPGFGENIAKEFAAAPTEIMRAFRSDQELLSQMVPQADTWQDFAPGKTASYKADRLDHGPGDACIVAMHGTPKPHEYPAAWIKEFWR